MNPFHDLKPEIKLFLIVAVASVFVAVAGILLLRESSPTPSVSEGKALVYGKAVALSNVQSIPGGPLVEGIIGAIPEDHLTSFAKEARQPNTALISQATIYSYFVNFSLLDEQGEFQFELDPGSYVLCYFSPTTPSEAMRLEACARANLERGERLTIKVEKMFGTSITGKGIETVPLTDIFPLEHDSFNASADTSTWQTYRNDEFGFEFTHPSWGETTGAFGPYFSGGSDLVLTLVSGQILGNHEGVSVHSNIEILPKLSNISLKERLETKYNIKDGQKGNIDTAYQQNQELSEYYWTVLKPSQKPGTAIEYPKGKIVYNEYSLNGIPIFELGDPGGSFTYMTFFLPQNKDYIYVLTLELSGAGNGESVVPPDSYFIAQYKEMVSTFRFVEEPEINWNWELLGCGGQTPCSYRVSSSQLSGVYMCAGKYNPLSGQGEVTPTPSTDPRTTTDFTCQLEE